MKGTIINRTIMMMMSNTTGIESILFESKSCQGPLYGKADKKTTANLETFFSKLGKNVDF
jgi:hypothetical protein